MLVCGGLPAGLIDVPWVRCARPGTHVRGPSAPETCGSRQCPLAPPLLSSACSGNPTAAEPPLHTHIVRMVQPFYIVGQHNSEELGYNVCVVQHYGRHSGNHLAKHTTIYLVLSQLTANFIASCPVTCTPHWLTAAVVGCGQKWHIHFPAITILYVLGHVAGGSQIVGMQQKKK